LSCVEEGDLARNNIFLVPVDFSRGSEKALDYALKVARKQDAKVISLHVIPAELIYPQTGAGFDLYGLMERDAKQNFQQLIKRKHLDAKNSTLMLARGTDFPAIIVRQAKKVGAAMIIMGSHGRTGVSRFLLGSVAERTLRYATCPVLIVK
jgi:nucleotide-binding universal stress UspA family protein